MSRIAESKHIYFGTVDALSSWSCRPAGDTFDLYFTFLFVANDGKRDRQSGRTQLVAKVLWRGNPLPSTAVITSPAFSPALAAAESVSTDATSTPSLVPTAKNSRSCSVR